MDKIFIVLGLICNFFGTLLLLVEILYDDAINVTADQLGKLWRKEEPLSLFDRISWIVINNFLWIYQGNSHSVLESEQNIAISKRRISSIAIILFLFGLILQIIGIYK